MGNAITIAAKAGIARQLAEPQDVTEGSELAVGAYGDGDLPVGAMQQLIGRDSGLSFSHPRRGRPLDGVCPALVDERSDQRRQQIDLDPLAHVTSAPMVK